MKYLLLILSLFLFFANTAFSSDAYSIYNPKNYSYKQVEEERTLFILDFSNSMNEFLDGERKIDLMINTMKDIIPKISNKSSIGLRVYGHRMGFTPFEACRASTLLVPFGNADSYNLENSLTKTKPKGMTPITYSLKEAVKNDFIGFSGKKHIILLTDGGENCDESPCKWVMELIKVRKDVVIDVIAFNISEEDDLAQLECTSLVTGGKFYTANTAAELSKSLNNSVNIKKDVEAKIIKN